MRRFSGGTKTPRALSSTVSPLMTMRPDADCVTPASALITLVLPAPERPNNAVMGACDSKATWRLKLPRRCAKSTVIIVRPCVEAAREPFGNQQCGQGQCDGN